MFTSFDWDGSEIQTKKPSIFLAYERAIPRETLAAWGGRAIVSGPAYLGDGSFELVSNRQSFTWQDEVAKKALRRILDDSALEAMKSRYRELRKEGAIRCDREGEVVLYEDRQIKAVGNTNASCGYFYLAAWIKPRVLESLEDAREHLAALRQLLGALPTEEEGRSEQIVETYLGCLYVLKLLESIAGGLEPQAGSNGGSNAQGGFA